MDKLININDLKKEEILKIYKKTIDFKNKNIIKKENKKMTVASLFYENSTRTINSFEKATKNLNYNFFNINPQKSSIQKGESLNDTIQTLNNIGVDLLIIRNGISGLLENKNFKIPIINAGDGMHQHPTQALLDFVTIKENKKELKNLNICILGDIKHSRVARSNIDLLKKFNCNIFLYSPSILSIDCYKEVKKINSYEEIYKKIDVLIILRMQFERQQTSYIPSIKEYKKLYTLTEERFKKLKKDCIVLHPGPVNIGIDMEEEVLKNKRCLVDKQVENGVYLRMSIIDSILGEKNE